MSNVMDKEYDPEQGLPNPDAGENKETGNVIGGLKASNANPGHSDEAKANNTARLNEMAENGQEGANTDSSSNVGKPTTD